MYYHFSQQQQYHNVCNISKSMFNDGTIKRGWKFTIWNLDFRIKALSPYTCH
ncbi:MAG: hypothetical protein LBT10_03570 [Methanobrevibacter sp.]|nr:hypothetical protein [Methanobrevibacter sp.]